MPLVSLNPFTGQRLAVYRPHSRAQLEAATDRAHAAFLGWRELAPAHRARHLRALARAIRAQRDELAALITAEVGKPISQSHYEVAKCALVCDHYARHGPALLADERPAAAPKNARVTFSPFGVVLAIMPWNFPLWQVFRAAAPALVAGNTLLLKPSSNVTGCALAIEKIFAAARVPAGLLQVLLTEVAALPALIADDRVRMITLTGSTRAGRHVAALAGAAMKPGVYELGGSDPYLVLADADLPLAAESCARARLTNSGQSCIGAKRFIVVASARAEFERLFVARMAARRVGDPTDPATEVGPLARRDLRAALHTQVVKSRRAGARLLLGGRALPGPGNFYAPTVLTDVGPGMPAYDEELFGPVAAIIPVRDEAEAIAVANDSAYGLGAAVFTRDRRRAREIAAQLDAGAVALNDFVRSDPALPFGGTKASGHGRELGAWGLRSFVSTKTIVG